jgi:hypothetical protein
MFAVQSIIISKKRYNTVEAAISKLEELGYKFLKVHETTENWRFRQRSPKDFDPTTFRTTKIRPGVLAIVGYTSGDSRPWDD